MDTPIHDFLKAYAKSEVERCHMPGHKGSLNAYDITEINRRAIEIIKQSERNTAELFRAGCSLFSCSGSTLALYAMMSICSGGRVAAMRNAHRSLIDAAILLDFEFDWFYDIDSIQDCIKPDTKAVFVTNIDYYGNVCDVPSVARICDKHNLPLLVDNAHGAYLVFTDSHPIRLGATMSVDSAHKTLPALTGAAYLHSKCVNPQLESAMELFGTSSPSYLILESLDLCNLHIANEKHRAESAFEAVSWLKESLTHAGYTLLDSDLLRVVVDSNAYGYSGAELAETLRQNGVVCEMHDSRFVILLFSTVTEKRNTQRVFEVMRSIERKSKVVPMVVKAERTVAVMSPRSAYFSFPKRTVTTRESVGEICAGVHVAIPPCSPIVMPGEVITEEIALLLEQSGIREVLCYGI